MNKHLLIAAAVLALAACGKKSDTPEAGSAAPAAGASSEAVPPSDASPLSDPAAQPIEGNADSAWVEMMGAWAETGRCDDDAARWIIEGEAFHLYETHCAVKSLALLQNGVKASAQCTVEGYEDPDTHVYLFLRQGDGSLTIALEGATAMNTGLFLCEGEETEL